MRELKLGVKAKDKVTGFEGIVIGHARHLTGCDTYGLKAKAKKGEPPTAGEWFDEGTLEVIGKGISLNEIKSKTGDGGPSENPIV